MVTPYLKPFNDQGGTLYVFPSVSKDLTRTFVSNDYEFKFSHFACLNIPDIYTGVFSEDSDIDTFNEKGFYIESLILNNNGGYYPGYTGTIWTTSDGIGKTIAENLQNYVMNFETAILNGEGDNDDYDNDILTNVSEKVFFNWLQKVGAIKFTESGTLEDYNTLADRTVQYIGNIDVMNTVDINGDSFEELYIHIPSTAKPRFPSGDTVADYYEGSEGYLVEVYANKVIFKPIDFIASEYLTKYNYTANVVQGTNEPTLPPEPTIIDIVWNDGVKIDRSTGAETSSSEYSASDFIACDNSKTYTLNLASDFPTHGGNVFACYYDENKSFISCGSDFIGSYQSSSDVYTADLSLPTNAKYIKLRLFAAVDASTMDKSIITLTTLAITTHTIVNA